MAKKYNNVLLKISGEILAGDSKSTFDNSTSKQIVDDITSVKKSGINLAVVVGGGNIIRGVNYRDFSLAKTSADHMGMLSTIIN